MTPNEVLTIARMRQWRAERTALRHGKTTRYRSTGWQQRTARQADARHVRVIDFERAFGLLDAEDQQILQLVYAERQQREDVARIMGWSVRKLSYKLPTALQQLASVLDRLDLL